MKKKNEKIGKEEEKTANWVNFRFYLKLEILRSSANKFCLTRPVVSSVRALFMILFRKDAKHWNHHPGSHRQIYFSSFLVFSRETNKKPTANIACDINEGKRKIKRNSCVRFSIWNFRVSFQTGLRPFESLVETFRLKLATGKCNERIKQNMGHC